VLSKAWWFAVLAAFFLGIGVVVAVMAATGGDDGGDRVEDVAASASTVVPTSTREPEPTAAPSAVPEPTATPVPTATTAAPAFRSCDEIRAAGTYLSEEERQFFLAQCTGGAPAPAGGTNAVTSPPAPPSSGPRPAPVERPGDYEFIGAVWPDESIPVRYCVNPANPPIGSDGKPMVSTETFVARVRQAFATWEQIPSSSISFSYQGLCESDPFDGRDGVNTVGWGWLFSGAIGLAHPAATNGQFLHDGNFGQIYEMDIVIDSRYGQSFDFPREYIDVDLPHILLHEVGHFLGLDHSENPCSVMLPSGIGSGLCAVDIEGASALYPAG
jgi:hypothetical protein